MKRKKKENLYMLQFPSKHLRKKVRSYALWKDKSMRDVIVEAVSVFIQGEKTDEQRNDFA